MPRVSGEKVKAEGAPQKTKASTCGLIMPISALDGCSAEHWAEVKSIITETVESIADPVFSVKLVSDGDAVGIIQKRIVQNVYASDIVVCDVSGKNPNVMFELGMRLAFDKPTVIVKDDRTDYSFDTGVIEHVPYPRDLRFTKIIDFKKLLAEKVENTHRIAAANPDHSTFLKSFGKFQVATLAETEVSPDKIVFGMLEELQSDIRRLRMQIVTRENDLGPIRGSGRWADSALARLTESVQKYIEREKCSDPLSLLGNKEFHQQVQMDVDAPRYFSSPKSFIEALEFVLKASKAQTNG
jgi:hypothetical protein